jgi:3'(2'), 5'-bisphosphate nucleotidase
VTKQMLSLQLSAFGAPSPASGRTRFTPSQTLCKQSRLLAHSSPPCRARTSRHTAPSATVTMPPSHTATVLTTPKPASATVDVGALLGACVDAVERAGAEIRAVQAARVADASSFDVSLKDASDPRTALTLADQRAQAASVGPLKRDFPGLAIVAEEDQEDLDDGSPALRRTCPDGLVTPESLHSVPLSDVCVWCDPLDATAEFCAGRMDSVQTLIGISVRGRAVAGVIGLPFHADGFAPPVVAMVGSGVVNLPPPEASRIGEGVVLASSQTPKEAEVKAAHSVVDAVGTLPLGGSGNKLLSVAAGASDIAVLNLVSSLWDTCASEAMLLALGGQLTDLFGNRINYFPGARIGNAYGVIATSSSFPKRDCQRRTHKELCRQMREHCVADSLLAASCGLVPSVPGEVQATDVARDVDGEPLTAEFLSTVVNAHVKSYSAPETYAVRYLMSDAVRLHLKYTYPESSGPKSLFYKVSDLASAPLSVLTFGLAFAVWQTL